MRGRLRVQRIFVLPALHLLACAVCLIGFAARIAYFGVVWEFLMLADLPVSIVAYLLGWRYPAIALTWVLIAGTLWWYLLSRVGQILFQLVRPGTARLTLPD